jgi:peptidoglycan/LPS O-acetylase OafA/YrhL
LKYRAEIDGLRALAVIPVILFHAGFELFSGGFVGVDVFFVISGYLITTILIEDIENKRFSIINFYERRARRILPALFFVMLVCIPFAWMWMLPNQMKDFSHSLVAVSLFASNILFWRKTGYFEAAAEEKPLLHTWSLAVEEQYYVLFPIFLILAWRFGKNRVFWMIVVMAAISLLLSEWGWRNKAPANFYLAPTRAWELFAGSIAAFIVQKQGVQKNNFLAMLGLAAIIFSIFFYDVTTPFPSVYALVPVLGVVLLVLYADKETLAAKFLSTKAIVAIGLISYSAYLWHQPLFAYARIRSLEHPSHLLMLTLSLSSILLAYVSWRYIEMPFRGNERLGRSRLFVASAVGLALFTALGLTMPKFTENVLYGRNFIEQNEYSQLSDTYVMARKAELRNVNFANANTRKILVIGDSNSGDLINALEFLFNEEDVSLSSLMINSGCGAVYVETDRYQQYIERRKKSDCNNADNLFSQRSIELMQAADLVIFASSWHDWQLSFLEESSQRLKGDFGSKFWWFGNKHLVFPNDRERSLLDGELNDSYPIRREKQLINEQMQRTLGDRFIDPYELLCVDNYCRIVSEEGKLLIYDGFHLSRPGARYLAEQMRSFIPQVLETWLTGE